MSDQHFDLTYTGLIAPGADPDETRQRLTAAFKLSDQGAERLFTGRPVVVKRDVDAATATRFKKVFAQAGAVLTITAVAGAEDTETDGEPTETDSTTPSQADGIDTAHLALAPTGGTLEPPPAAAPPALDTSHLSLVSGQHWTLEDCEPPPTPIPEPDISYLSLAPASSGDHPQPNPDSTQ